MPPIPDPALPTLAQLWRATAIAALVAAVILVTIVLPVEYGIDPTGSGRTLGLFRAPAADARASEVAKSDPAEGDAIPASATLIRKSTPFRTDEMSLVLESGEGGEIKAVMGKGEQFVYSWVAEGGPVDVDMHGEASDAKNDEFTSYWKDEGQERDSGTFAAPVTGRHGWFWQNLNDQTVTVRLKTSGFYEKLIRP